MRSLFIRVTMAVAAATVVSPVQAQIASPAAAPPPWPPAAYSGSSSFPYPFPAPTPEDAYKDGLINRWTYEQIQGPLPAAMQGPSPTAPEEGAAPAAISAVKLLTVQRR